MWAVLLLPACLTGPGDAEPAAPLVQLEDPGPRNVLMVTVDTLRRDALGRYGGPDTPFLDTLLADSVTFDDHLSCSNWTYSSLLCALSCETPLDLGFLPLHGGGAQPLPSDVTLLAERLTDQGYATGSVTASPFLGPRYGTHRGYGVNLVEEHAPAEDLVLPALVTLSELQESGQPWFLHVWVTDPHVPYNPPADLAPDPAGLPEVPWDLRTTRGFADMRDAWKELDDQGRSDALTWLEVLYAAEVQATDRALGDLWDAARALGALDDTLTVLWSDHGEQFAEHNQFSHGGSLHREETAAVMAFHHPALSPVAWSGPTTHTDLVPTLFRALDLPDWSHCQGWEAGLAPDTRLRSGVRYQDTSDPLQLIDQDDFRLLYDWGGSLELFDGLEDPGELVDVADRERQRMGLLTDQLTHYVDQLDALQDVHHPGGLDD